jgi:hypothetical protein
LRAVISTAACTDPAKGGRSMSLILIKTTIWEPFDRLRVSAISLNILEFIFVKPYKLITVPIECDYPLIRVKK